MASNSKIAIFLFIALTVSCGNDKGYGLVGGKFTKKIFVTAATTTGNAGGISGADNLCATDANNPNDGYSYVALISDGLTRVGCTTAFCSGGDSEHVDWPLDLDTTYVRASDGVEIGTTSPSAGIFAFPLTAAFVSSGTNYWTGLETDWRSDTVDDCSGFTGTGGFGANGSVNSTSNTAIKVNEISCTTNRAIVCVEI